MHTVNIESLRRLYVHMKTIIRINHMHNKYRLQNLVANDVRPYFFQTQ